MGDETVVHITVVGEVQVCVVEKVVVELMPGMFDECDSNIAKGRRELGSMLHEFVERCDCRPGKCMCPEQRTRW